eukprot:861121-Pelagomonas_calceolata.AAC.4
MQLGHGGWLSTRSREKVALQGVWPPDCDTEEDKEERRETWEHWAEWACVVTDAAMPHPGHMQAVQLHPLQCQRDPAYDNRSALKDGAHAEPPLRAQPTSWAQQEQAQHRSGAARMYSRPNSLIHVECLGDLNSAGEQSAGGAESTPGKEWDPAAAALLASIESCLQPLLPLQPQVEQQVN